MLITSWVWCSPFLHARCRPPLRVLLLSSCVTESRPQNNSRETIMDPPTGLPDPGSEGFWNNVGGRPAFRSPELQPETSEREDLGRELLETKNVSLIPWGEALSMMGVAWAVPLKEGRGGGVDDCLVGITWGPWVLKRLCSQLWILSGKWSQVGLRKHHYEQS